MCEDRTQASIQRLVRGQLPGMHPRSSALASADTLPGGYCAALPQG